VIDDDVATFVDDLERKSGQNRLKYGNGPLDATLVQHGPARASICRPSVSALDVRPERSCARLR